MSAPRPKYEVAQEKLEPQAPVEGTDAESKRLSEYAPGLRQRRPR